MRMQSIQEYRLSIVARRSRLPSKHLRMATSAACAVHAKEHSMNTTDLHPAATHAAQGRILRLHDGAASASKRCSGTVDHDGQRPARHLHRAGEGFTIDRSGDTLISALDDASLVVLSPSPAPARLRLRRCRAGDGRYCSGPLTASGSGERQHLDALVAQRSASSREAWPRMPRCSASP
jgi:hypothetical protein